MGASSLWFALLVACAALAGCSGGSSPGPSDLPDPTGPQGAGAGSTPEPGAAPDWAVGQWWTYSVEYSTQAGDPLTAVVASASPAAYVLAAGSEAWAKQEAAFGHPLLGAITRPDLAMTGWSDGATWSLLQFPLRDGSTWTTTLPNLAWDVVDGETVEAQVQATQDASIGTAGGYRLAATWEGSTLIEATYDNAAQWFGMLQVNDVDPGQEPLEVRFTLTESGNASKGAFTAQAREVLAFDDLSGFSDVPVLGGGQPFTDPPAPMHQFTMEGGDGAMLYGVVWGETVAGARQMVLTDPANQPRQWQAIGTPNGFFEVGFDEPSQAGTWTLATAGAGGFSGAGAWLFEVVVAPVA